MNKPSKLLRLITVMAITGVILFGAYSWKRNHRNDKSRISYTLFVDKVNSGEIIKVRMEGDEIRAESASGARFHLFRPVDADLSKLLIEKHIDLSAKPVASSAGWVQAGIGLLMIIPLFFVLRRLLVFSHSRAKITDGTKSQTFFRDVAGVDEAKADLLETVEFLRDPEPLRSPGGSGSAGYQGA